MAPRSRPCFVLAMLLALLSCGERTDHEREPNDNRLSAQAFPEKGVLQGSFAGGGSDLDFSRIEVRDEQRLEFRFDMKEGSWDQLRFMNLEGAVFKRFSGESAPRGHFEFQVWCAPGSYFLEISGTSRRELPYEIRLVRVKDALFEREPDDTPEQATEGAVNAKMGGYHFPRDEDWFHYKSRDEKPRHLSIDLSGVAGVDAFLEIFDGKVDALMRIDNGGPGESETVRHLRFDTNGLFLKVHTKGGAVFQNKPYALFAEAVELDPSWETEPNDLPGLASPWPENRDELSGLIAWRGDQDWISMPMPTNREGSLHLTLTPPQNLSLALSLHRDDGTLIDVVRDLPPGAPLTWNESAAQGLAGEALIRLCVKASGRTYDPIHRYSLRRSMRAR